MELVVTGKLNKDATDALLDMLVSAKRSGKRLHKSSKQQAARPARML